MEKILQRCLWVLVGLCLATPTHADVQIVKDNVAPNRIRPVVLVLSAGWMDRIPPDGRVNAPETLETIYPGQKVALALIAEGPEREKLLGAARLSVRFTSPSGGVAERHDLKPVVLRQIKAEGADMALAVMNAAGISGQDRAKMEQATSMVSFAIFQPDWTAPMLDRAEDVQINVSLVDTVSGVALEPITIKLRPTGDWLNEPAPSQQEMGKYLTRFHLDLPPGRLLSLLNAAALNGSLKADTIAGYFTVAYRENPAARDAAIALLPSLTRKAQVALTFVFRKGGQDISRLSAALPPDTVASFEPVEPWKDPRNLPHFADPVTPAEVGSVGNIMDQCWSGWMATGDQSYLRALVGLLAGAPDFPAFQAWTKNKGGVKGLNASVGRGLAYQIAGWSIGSFQRTDPYVADWLLYWEHDPKFPAELNREITSLPANPAFRRN